MKLSQSNLSRLDGKVRVPSYDREEVSVGIVHFGVGGFHRSHQAMYIDRLMNLGLALDWGICGIGVMPEDAAMRDTLNGQDCLYTLMVRDGVKSPECTVIGSIVDYLYAPDSPEQVLGVLADPRTRIVSLTVTEGGYNIDPVSGLFDADSPAVRSDVAGHGAPTTMFGYVVEALRRRREGGIPPFSVMSCDNIESNGDVARATIVAFALLRDPGLSEWIAANVAFPSSMVDRITPVTTPADVAELRSHFDIEDRWPVVCEPFTQWVLQDTFVTDRPPLERVGVQLTDHVEPYEKMKLRLLNASHQALAYFGYLSGYTYAHEAASDPQFGQFLLGYMNFEGRPTLDPVPGIQLDSYIKTLIERFQNPGTKDTLARLCAFSSDRIPKWLLPVIRYNLEHGGKVDRSIAVVASWARYAEGLDEAGRPIDVQDTMREDLMARAARYGEDPLAFVRNEQLFGDLAEDSVFAEKYSAYLDALHRLGARRTVQALNEGSSA